MSLNDTVGDNVGGFSQNFGWIDFTFFGLMLGSSTLIGIYFGYCGKKEDTPKEYLHGGKTMGTVPVAVSLVSSTISGITVMGVPSEIYTYGTLYWLVCVSAVLVGIVNSYFYLPVFYELQLTSTYEYLELRFSQSVRIMASVLCTISLLLYIPIVVYVPALALSQVSGLNLHYITPVISITCIFYTMLGGLKAVVWTDFLQGIIMVVSSIAVIILGLIHVGGFGAVWERSRDGGRIRVFELDPSPFERMTFWIVVFGNTVGWMGLAVNQAMVQKFMSLSSYSRALKSLVFFVAGLIIIKCISCFTGLLIFAAYHDCDPIKTKAISRPDQLLTYYVMDIASYVPGLSGLFIAGILSAALSTMSSNLNSLGATLFEDFIRPCLNRKISDRTANTIIKSVVGIVGGICIFIVFIVEKLGGILQLSMSVGGVTGGATLGLFSFGMFYPRGNAKGALAGSISSLLFMGWIVFGTQKALADGTLKQPMLPTTAVGCGFNETLPESSNDGVPEEEEVFILYRVSFMYYTFIGMAVVFIVGILVSHLTEAPKLEDMNPALFTPIVRRFVENKTKKHDIKEPAEKELLNIIHDD